MRSAPARSTASLRSETRPTSISRSSRPTGSPGTSTTTSVLLWATGRRSAAARCSVTSSEASGTCTCPRWCPGAGSSTRGGRPGSSTIPQTPRRPTIGALAAFRANAAAYRPVPPGRPSRPRPVDGGCGSPACTASSTCAPTSQTHRGTGRSQWPQQPLMVAGVRSFLAPVGRPGRHYRRGHPGLRRQPPARPHPCVPGVRARHLPAQRMLLLKPSMRDGACASTWPGAGSTPDSSPTATISTASRPSPSAAASPDAALR